MHLVHLPAWRNPLDELARRETLSSSSCCELNSRTSVEAVT